ncbi:hypothetical protein M0R45_035041 [Rubus argutus]|uniref:PRA1 family protein n=1 Tax=Rubus argutus TaxID=59490 RepID=A0AAW1VUY9_RUBAR
MASPSTTSPSSPTLPTTHPHEPIDSTPRVRIKYSLSFPFNIPKTPEAAAARITRNLGYFRLYYAVFIWTILFITLVPKSKFELIYLVAMTCSYLALLWFQPADSVVGQGMIICRGTVLVFMLIATDPIATMVELILTEEACAAGELVPLRNQSDPKLSDSV